MDDPDPLALLRPESQTRNLQDIQKLIHLTFSILYPRFDVMEVR